MNTNMHSNTRNSATAGTPASAANFMHLEDMDSYKVADGDPDIRGWDVVTADGRTAGKVEGLIVDSEALRVAFLDVELDRDGLSLKDDRHVLVPISTARLDDKRDHVMLGSIRSTDLAAMQPYHHGQTIVPSAAMPCAKESDVRKFYGKRGGSGVVEQMTLSEEELRLGTRSRDAGAVKVRKTVETKHVSTSVPVTHEEVTIERRPISAESARNPKITEDEVRIPLSAEEVVVEKRVVPKEELIIRKHTIQGEQKVEADLKRERAETANAAPTANTKGKKTR